MVSIASTVLLADMWDGNGHMGGGWWIVMMIGMVVFWAAVIVVIVWVARCFPNGWRESPLRDRETPQEILDRRFAEGAISVDEYHERQQAIRSGPRGQ